MMLNKSKGNMYPWVTHTWNVIKGKCPHDCIYCYMKKWGEQPALHFDEKEIKTDLGSGNIVFVGSSCDMWAAEIPYDWILKIMNHCCAYDNKYLFQTKDPARYEGWFFPDDTMLGCTIETNRVFHTDVPYPLSKSPQTWERMMSMENIKLPKMVSIEPILDFDTDVLIHWIKRINPAFVSIGADSKGNNLPEPSPDKVEALIKELQAITQVKIKDNLKRLRQELPQREGQ